MFEFAYNDIVDDSPQSRMRAQEGRALDQVLELLREAAKAGTARGGRHGAGSIASPVGRLPRRSQSPENGLPDALRAGIISIGIWVNREIDRVRSRRDEGSEPADRNQSDHSRRLKLRRS